MKSRPMQMEHLAPSHNLAELNVYDWAFGEATPPGGGVSSDGGGAIDDV